MAERGNLRDLLAERMLRLERGQGETNARIDQTNARLDQTNARLDQTNERLEEVVGVLGGMANVMLALKDGQERLIDRVDGVADRIAVGFASHEARIDAIDRRVTRLEEEG